MEGLLLKVLGSQLFGNSTLVVILMSILWIAAGNKRQDKEIELLFEQDKKLAAGLSTLTGEHNAARALSDCPMEGLSATLTFCPLLKASEKDEADAAFGLTA